MSRGSRDNPHQGHEAEQALKDSEQEFEEAAVDRLVRETKEEFRLRQQALDREYNEALGASARDYENNPLNLHREEAQLQAAVLASRQQAERDLYSRYCLDEGYLRRHYFERCTEWNCGCIDRNGFSDVERVNQSGEGIIWTYEGRDCPKCASRGSQQRLSADSSISPRHRQASVTSRESTANGPSRQDTGLKSKSSQSQSQTARDSKGKELARTTECVIPLPTSQKVKDSTQHTSSAKISESATDDNLSRYDQPRNSLGQDDSEWRKTRSQSATQSVKKSFAEPQEWGDHSILPAEKTNSTSQPSVSTATTQYRTQDPETPSGNRPAGHGQALHQASSSTKWHQRLKNYSTKEEYNSSKRAQTSSRATPPAQSLAKRSDLDPLMHKMATLTASTSNRHSSSHRPMAPRSLGLDANLSGSRPTHESTSSTTSRQVDPVPPNSARGSIRSPGLIEESNSKEDDSDDPEPDDPEYVRRQRMKKFRKP